MNDKGGSRENENVKINVYTRKDGIQNEFMYCGVIGVIAIEEKIIENNLNDLDMCRKSLLGRINHLKRE